MVPRVCNALTHTHVYLQRSKKHLPDLPLAQGQFAPRVYHHLQALHHRLGV
jgi:hypothetical protein